MEKKLIGNIEIRIGDHGLSLQIPKLFPYTENGDELTIKDIKELLKTNYSYVNLNESIINWYLAKSKSDNILFTNVTLSVGKIPKPAGSQILEMSHEDFKVEDLIYWEFVYNFFEHMTDNDLTMKLPTYLFYVKKGGVIASQHVSMTDMSGHSFNNELIQADRHRPLKYTYGDHVIYDDAQRAFIATTSGYVYIHDNKVIIESPFFVSSDKLNLFFMNFERMPFIPLSKIDISTYLLRHKIDMNMAHKNLKIDVPAGEPIKLVTGKEAGESVDAAIEILVVTETKQPPIDENGVVNYREINQFPSVSKDELLAKKKIAIRGEDGATIFGNPILPRNPKDLPLKQGHNTYTKEIGNEILYYSSEDGRIEYKNGIISVFDQLKIDGDIDYHTGNIDTKVNIHIEGSVRTGFSVKSEKSIFIRGTVEDGCTIESGGDLIINGGISGKSNIISSQGNMGVKFIEGGKIFVKGQLTVHRFIMGAVVDCMDTISVMGAGINLNEKGAILDSEIYVRNIIYCPTLGNDVGQKTYINFGYNKLLNQKIKNYEDALQKISQNIDDLNNQFDVDITAPNIHSLIKDYLREKKDKVIAAIQEKNRLEKQHKMISGILEKEIEIKREEIINSAVYVTNKVFPPLHLECENTKKVIDQIHPPSKYCFNEETGYIERDRFLLGKEKYIEG